MPKIITVTPYTAIDRVIALERLDPGKVLQAESSVQYPAGKGVNVGRTVASLEEKVIMLGLVGSVHHREFENLQSDKITARFLNVHGETRMNISLFDKMAQQTTHIRTPGFQIEREHMSKLVVQIRRTVAPGDFVVLAGSLPQGAEVDSYADLVTASRDFEAQVILDAHGEALREGIRATPFMIKPNIRELRELTGDDSIDSTHDIIAAARQIVSLGVSVVVVSRGVDGAIAVSDNLQEVWSAKVISTLGRTPVNHVGCGDALVGGMAVGLARGLTLPESLRLGVACGTANLFTTGPGQCELQVIGQMKENTQLERLE